MSTHTDILVCGTGSFAARIVFDIAATAANPVHVVIAGRNRARLDWLVLASNARASIFATPARFSGAVADLASRDGPAALLEATKPAIVVQAASAQTSSVIATQGDRWSALVSRGGLSATAVFQTLITARVAQAIATASPRSALVNCCFPDVVNGLIKAMGHAVLAGMGNVAILAHAFAGSERDHIPLKILAHYQNLAAWRQPKQARAGTPPRVWIEGREISDVYGRFADVKLTPEPVIDISGASGVPLVLAYAANEEWRGHLPGPDGLPGGYPVRLENRVLSLDLPAGLERNEAITWNDRFEAESGLTVTPDGKVRYTGLLLDALQAHSPELAAGFHILDLETVFAAMLSLRERLQASR